MQISKNANSHKFDLFDDIFQLIIETVSCHNRTSETYSSLAKQVRPVVESLFSDGSQKGQLFGPFGELVFPFHKMGAVDSLDLFGLDELIILAFYWANKDKYKNVLDLGANLGLHSIAMDRCGYNVKCFEPDPDTFKLLSSNLKSNKTENVEAFEAAVSIHDGEAEFVRVNGNRTGSHLVGSKEKPYGNLEYFPVTVFALEPLAYWADLIKMDVEGHEAALIESIGKKLWQNVDVIMEVGTQKNAHRIFEFLSGINVNMFAQKIGWKLVQNSVDLPTEHSEGSLFVSMKSQMPWKLI